MPAELENISKSYNLTLKPRFNSETASSSGQFVIEYKDYIKAGVLQGRLLVNSFIKGMCDNGWFFSVPKQVLMQDVARIYEDFKRKKYTTPYGYPAFSSAYAAGRLALMHFMPWATMSNSPIEKEMTPRLLHKIIRRLLATKKSITQDAIARKMGLLGFGPKFIDPNIYRRILNDIGISGVVIADPEPGCGSKLIASSAEECPYFSGDVPYMQSLRNLADFIGSEIGVINDRSFDLVILDGDLRRPPDIGVVKEWSSKVDSMIVLAYPNRLDEYMEIVKPDKVLKIMICPGMIFPLLVRI